MTRSVEIPDAAVEAAQEAWTKAYWTEATPGKADWMRAALEAASPYLVPSATCASIYRGRAGLEKCTLDPGHEDNHVGFRTVWTDEDSATPVGDGGLREALERLAEKWATMDTPGLSAPSNQEWATGVDQGYANAAAELLAVLAGEQEQDS